MKNEYCIMGDYVIIKITSKGEKYEYLIDLDDLPMLDSYTGTFSRGSDGYAYASFKTSKGNRKKIAMHRMIMQPDEKLVVDHINRNTLDNRRSNLRIITISQNSQNIYGNKRSRTGVRGVSKNSKKWGKPWRARLRVDGRDVQLGAFDSIEEAERVVIEARKKYMPYSVEIN